VYLRSGILGRSSRMRYISSLLTHWLGRSLPTEIERYRLLMRTILPSRELLYSSNAIAFCSKYGGFTNWQIKMVCFTDMPLSASEAHSTKYSRFGIALHKHAMANCCVAPVGYTLSPFVYEAYSYLYHHAAGLKNLVEGVPLPTGRAAGEPFSSHKFMQKLHEFIVLSQGYSDREFIHDERTIVPREDMAAFFHNEHAYYYEREWRTVYRNGDKFCWVAEHDGKQYFRFDWKSIRYVIVPESFVRVAAEEIPAIAAPQPPPQIVAFEHLATGDYDE
jgi:hypothetical protein